MTGTTQKLGRFNGLWTVFKKEVVDNLRDRRTLTTIAASVIISPLILIGFLWFAEKTVKEETDPVSAEAFQLPVIGAELAPNLMNWLRQNNIEILDPPTDPEAVIKSGERRVVMVIKPNFVDAFESGRTAPVLLIHDSSVSGLERLGLTTVQRALGSYGSQIAQLRLVARGISPDVVQPIQINMSDVATPESRNAEIVGMMPYLIIMFIMAGGMYLAIDSTAGEREKGSLESLLTLPVPRKDILLAKLLATSFFSAVTLLFMLISLSLFMQNAPVDAFNFNFTTKKLLHIFFTCLPFVFVASSMLILLASFTKSYKEAQSYLSFVMLIPTMPLMLLMFLSPEASMTNMWVPSLSQALIIVETIKGEIIPWHLTALSMSVSLLVAVIFSMIAIKLYQRERILG